jgi:hypothetical protein
MAESSEGTTEDGNSENTADDSVPKVTPVEGSEVAVEIEWPDKTRDKVKDNGGLDKRFKNQKDKKPTTEKKPEPQTPEDKRGVVDSVLELIGNWFGS